MIVGIDIGTSYSSISILKKDGTAEPVHVSTGMSIFGDNYSLPSAVYVEDTKISIGQAALQNRQKKPENFKSEFKRDLGQEIPYTLGNLQLLPEDLYKELFIHLKKCAEDANEGQKIELACITHPANYNDRKKKLVKVAANKAGLLNVVLIDEPTAAAVYLFAGKEMPEGTRFLIYDFGGGTFDVALIEYGKNDFMSITETLGLEQCGGIDIDRLIFDDIKKELAVLEIEALKANPVNLKRFSIRLIETSVKAKHQLSTIEHFSDDIDVGLFDYRTYEMDRSKFNGLISGLVEETIELTKQIIKNAKLEIGKVEKVLMVGGTSRIPLVKETLERLSGNVQSIPNPELAVSLGAAYYGYKLINKPKADPSKQPQKPLQIQNPLQTIQVQHKTQKENEKVDSEKKLTVAPFSQKNMVKEFFNTNSI